MGGIPTTIVLVIAVLVVLTLASERRDWVAGKWLAKPLAAAGYIWLALDAGASGSTYGRWVLAALALSWLGDVLLIPRERPRVFRVGVLAFMLGHVAYVAAFLLRGVEPATLLGALAAMTVPCLVVLRWLSGRVPGPLVRPVRTYIIVICVMFAAAYGTHAHQSALLILVGAGLFWLSDLCVARDRFVGRNFANRLLGLPLYFAGQVMLALSVAN